MSISSPGLRFPARSGAGPKNRASRLAAPQARDSKNRPAAPQRGERVWLLHAKLLAGGLWVMLLAASPARAGIAFVPGSFTCTNNGTVVTSLQLTLAASTATGNTVAVATALASKTDTVSSVVDSGLSSYTKRASLEQTSGGAGQEAEIWTTTAGGANASTTVTVNITGSGLRFNFCIAEYSGANGIGVTATNSATTGNPTLSLTTQDNNDFLVAAIAASGGTTLTASTGNLRGQSGSTQVAVSGVCDNTAATPSSVTCAVTNSKGGIWVEVGFDLRLTSCTPHINWMTGVGTPLGC